MMEEDTEFRAVQPMPDLDFEFTAEDLNDVAKLVAQCRAALDAADISNLDEEHKQQFRDIRVEYSNLLREAFSFRLNYKPVFNYARDCLNNNTPVTDIFRDLESSGIKDIHETARKLAASAYSLTLNIESLLGILRHQYPKLCTSWTFLANVGVCAVCVAGLFACLATPGAQMMALSFGMCALGSGARAYAEFSKKDSFNKACDELNITLNRVREHSENIRESATSLQDDALKVRMAMSNPGRSGNDKKYVNDMCDAFDRLDAAIDNKPDVKSDGLNTFGNAALMAGVGTGVIAVAKTDAVLEAGSAVTACLIM